MFTETGWIDSASWRIGGYNDAMVGLDIRLMGKGWGTSVFRGAWHGERSPESKWSEGDRLAEIGRAGLYAAELMKQAGVDTLEGLEGTPVQAEFDNSLKLVSWRIMTEVIKPRR